ncbi:MAG: HAMP domain-containing histidine kinase, partial [Bacteroides sp.]|nr:HAMP domain-containing histidine kinase [Bacteroides sp.]
IELTPSDKKLNVERGQIEQVLINLLKNAREASARCEKPMIEVKAHFTPKITSATSSYNCNITVRDNGEGILPEVQDKIFVPFFTTKASGSGIGLSLCKQIMNQHGGNISVYSEPGKGSCFTLQFN